jgi:hypothetical protein
MRLGGTAVSRSHSHDNGGPRRIWPIIEHTTTLWNQLGRPTRDRFGLTVTSATIRDYWLDQPSNKLGDLTVSGQRADDAAVRDRRRR